MGHELRHENLLKEIIEKDVEGHIARERPRAVRLGDTGYE